MTHHPVISCLVNVILALGGGAHAQSSVDALLNDFRPLTANELRVV
jgi:hypothetical protein